MAIARVRLRSQRRARFASTSPPPPPPAFLSQAHSGGGGGLRLLRPAPAGVVVVDLSSGAVSRGQRPVGTTASSSSLPALARAASTSLLRALLPAGHPASVAASYDAYALLAAGGAAASAAGGVLSTQCLLYAVGLIGAGAAPLAAGLSWVLKDGLGQAGGVAFAALVGSRFDADPKRWRLLAALASDAACALEVATAFAGPALFLPLAAVANGLRNVAWLSASATRAAVHQALAASGNLADVTAKAGAQTIAASTAGMAAGVGLSAALGGGADALPAFAAAAAGLSAAHLALVHASLAAAVLPTLSPHRLWLAARGAIEEGVGAPVVVGDERHGAGSLAGGARAAARVLSPAAVAPAEPILLPSRAPSVAVGADAGSVEALHHFAAASDVRASHYVVYLLAAPRAGSARDEGAGAGVLYAAPATWRDVILGHLTAHRAAALAARRAATTLDERVAAVADARAWAAADGGAAVDELERAGWWVGLPLLEGDADARVTLSAGAEAARDERGR